MSNFVQIIALALGFSVFVFFISFYVKSCQGSYSYLIVYNNILLKQVDALPQESHI